MCRKIRCYATRGPLLLILLLLAPLVVQADQARPEMARQEGDRVPIFQVATSQGRLADYDRDYYGRHHLVLTFIPAAFTPI